MKKGLERRSYNFEIQAEQNEDNIGVITGRPIVYDSCTDLGFFVEVIAAGALDKTDLRDVRFLVNHDTSKIPLARSRNNNANSTMQLSVDDKGLAIRVNLDIENNSEACNLYSAIKRGDISGMSFKFAVDGEEWSELDTEHPKRTITSISSVIEVSAATFPAYEDTEIQARNLLKALESAKSTLDSVKRSQVSDLELERLKIEMFTKGR